MALLEPAGYGDQPYQGAVGLAERLRLHEYDVKVMEDTDIYRLMQTHPVHIQTHKKKEKGRLRTEI